MQQNNISILCTRPLPFSLIEEANAGAIHVEDAEIGIKVAHEILLKGGDEIIKGIRNAAK